MIHPVHHRVHRLSNTWGTLQLMRLASHGLAIRRFDELSSACKGSSTAAVRSSIASNDGYSLIELMVALTIVVLLATAAVPQVGRYLDRAKSDTARVEIGNIGAMLDMYQIDVGRYPTTEEGLVALVEQPREVVGWNGPYVKRKDMLLDPWGRGYRYRSPGEHGDYDLFTLGADDAEGGNGRDKDVTSF